MDYVDIHSFKGMDSASVNLKKKVKEHENGGSANYWRQAVRGAHTSLLFVYKNIRMQIKRNICNVSSCLKMMSS